MIDFVYFDAGGTLIEPHPSVGVVYARAGAPHGLTAEPESLEAAFRSAWAAHVEVRGDEPLRMGQDDASTRAWWRRLVFQVFDSVGYEGDREECFRALFDAFASADAWRVFADVMPVLDGLRARSVRAGVISNWDYRLTKLLESTGLRAHLDPVLISANEGIAKPDPALFRRALDRIGIPADRVAFVGDHVDLDLEPARAVGMHAFLIDRRLRHRGPHVLADLKDLLDRL
jgi:putative hydrolase of the HAD superfamily